MDKKGLTKNQFWIQMVPAFLYILLSIYWIISGIINKKAFWWIMGVLFLAITIGLIVALVIQRKRFPINDATLDEKVASDFKENMKAIGIIYAIIAGSFLLAFGLVAILK